MASHLFPNDPACDPNVERPAAPTQPVGRGTPRVRKPSRHQIEMRELSLDELLDRDDPARLVWEAACRFNIQPWLDEIKAVEGHAGRDGTDPRLLLSLWLLATLDGVTSGRELAKLCTNHRPYEWLCGGVSVNYDLLNGFRSGGGEKWKQLLTDIVGSLLNEGLVTLDRVAQDGMRVRADAGKSSFRTEGTLEEHLARARQRVEELEALRDDPNNTLTKREYAARKRHAQEREHRVQEAINVCHTLQADREELVDKRKKPPKPPRASTTDPEAQIMKFANGGYDPGVNVQFSTDTQTGIIVGTEVVSSGSDQLQLVPMLEQIQEEHGQVPNEATLDGGYGSLEQIETATAMGCTVYIPPREEQKQLDAGKDPYAKKRGDSPALAAWRARMGTEMGQAIYKLRCQTAEWVNARCRNWGLRQMPVRGLKKCGIIAVLYAITNNVLVAGKLRAEASAAKLAAAGG